MKDFWKAKLTPYDAELCMMIQSLTGKPCEPKNGGDKGYFLVVDYSDHKDDSRYIGAVMDAVLGRIGDRWIDLKDNPDTAQFIVHVRYSKDRYPAIRRAEMKEPKPEAGAVYELNLPPRLAAVKVTETDIEKLIEFVGNGEVEGEGEDLVLLFIDPVSGLWQHAPAGSYVVYDNDRFFVANGKELEKWYRPAE